MRFYGGSTAFYGVAESTAFYQGGSLSSLVPDTYNVSIDGRPYMLDLSQPFYRQYHRQVAPLIRTQADTSKQPGEQTMDPNSLWRRSFEDQSLGAGQRYLDRETSVDNAFWQSKGIDCLSNKWQMTLLPDTRQVVPTATTNLSCLVVNGYIYVAYGTTLKFTSVSTPSGPWSTCAGTGALSSICTDGYTVYGAGGTGGVVSTVAGTFTCATYLSAIIGSTAVVGYVNGRLMLGNNFDGTHGDGKLYNITASGTGLPTALLAPASATNTTWVGFAEGNTFLYAAAQVGSKGLIYGCTVTSDGTSLAPPSVQGALPHGEDITAIYGYLGNLVIGSTLGVRFAQATTAGVALGSLISGQTSTNAYGPTSSVQCLWGYGRWVWFGWTNYDSGSTGLGRLDLENFVIQDDLPAFCSDVMIPFQGAVLCVVAVGGYTLFGVSGYGFWTTDGTYANPGTYVASGTFQSGYILYDLIDPKIASMLDLQTLGTIQYGSVTGSVSTDAGAFVAYAQVNPDSLPPYSYALPGVNGQRFEVMITIARDASVLNYSPVLTRWTLRVYPAPVRPITWQLPLILDEEVSNRSGNAQAFDPLVELQALEAMASQGLPVVYQESHESYQVFVQDVEFLPDALTEDHHYFNGIALVTLEGLPVPYQSN